MSKTFAQILSYLLHPALIPSLGTAFVFWATAKGLEVSAQIQVIGFVFIATYLLPSLISVILKHLGIIESLHMNNPRDRRYPFLISIAFFLFTANTLQPWPFVPAEIPLLLLSSALTLIIFYLLLKIQKLSVHMAGMGGLIAILLFVSLQYEVQALLPLAMCFSLAGLLGTARLKLNAHTPFQVYTGFSLGFLITLILCVSFTAL